MKQFLVYCVFLLLAIKILIDGRTDYVSYLRERLTNAEFTPHAVNINFKAAKVDYIESRNEVWNNNTGFNEANANCQIYHLCTHGPQSHPSVRRP